ncbi:hypothetical protein [Brevibacillus choshinensis]|uniref:hypothetical protein n=1 Tax=Brevibacillus choshinensis TaxID=54911 RepID=UPI002E225679|nr:hypothetical protein [Brevibacillus choshinensis]
MTREQAIFLESMDDLSFEGNSESLIFAYCEFQFGVDFSTANDIEVQRRAKMAIKKYQEYWEQDRELFDERYIILDQLDLDDADWEYLDYSEEERANLINKNLGR